MKKKILKLINIVMKKLLFTSIILFSFVAIYSCDNNKTQNETKNDKNNNDLVSEKPTSVTNAPKTNNGKPVHLTKETFLELVMDYNKNPQTWVFKGDLPCIIDFYADWCRPCRMAAPVLEELAAEYEGKVNIYKVDTQTQKELSAVFGIQSLPSFLYCPKQGNPQMSSGIGRTTEETKAMFVKKINEILLK